MFRTSVLVLLCLSAYGCCHVDSRAVHITLSKDLQDPVQRSTLEVHIVAVNDSDYNQWKYLNMQDYWKVDNALRETTTSSAKTKVLTFGANNTQILLANDGFWDRQDDPLYIFVLSNTPSEGASQPGNQDPRRRVFPLGKCHWSGDQAIEIQLTPSGWITLTPPSNWQAP
jgi:hypothetical protein